MCPLQKSNSTETDKAGGDAAENEGTSRLTGRASGTPSVADRDLDAEAAALEADKKRWAPRARANRVLMAHLSCLVVASRWTFIDLSVAGVLQQEHLGASWPESQDQLGISVAV